MPNQEEDRAQLEQLEEKKVENKKKKFRIKPYIWVIIGILVLIGVPALFHVAYYRIDTSVYNDVEYATCGDDEVYFIHYANYHHKSQGLGAIPLPGANKVVRRERHLYLLDPNSQEISQKDDMVSDFVTHEEYTLGVLEKDAPGTSGSPTNNIKLVKISPSILLMLNVNDQSDHFDYKLYFYDLRTDERHLVLDHVYSVKNDTLSYLMWRENKRFKGGFIHISKSANIYNNSDAEWLDLESLDLLDLSQEYVVFSADLDYKNTSGKSIDVKHYVYNLNTKQISEISLDEFISVQDAINYETKGVPVYKLYSGEDDSLWGCSQRFTVEKEEIKYSYRDYDIKIGRQDLGLPGTLLYDIFFWLF